MSGADLEKVHRETVLQALSKNTGKIGQSTLLEEINILKSTLSVDHRVLDGAVAAKLLKDFNDIIENPFDLWLQSKDMEII